MSPAWTAAYGGPALRRRRGRRRSPARARGRRLRVDRRPSTAAPRRPAPRASATCRALRATVAYLKEREQFGVPIGSFQALQHKAVDMYAEMELCRGR
ncbi:MAG: acyl-CoA dehydrogenase family protein [Myxococcota bacterium]